MGCGTSSHAVTGNEGFLFLSSEEAPQVSQDIKCNCEATSCTEIPVKQEKHEDACKDKTSMKGSNSPTQRIKSVKDLFTQSLKNVVHQDCFDSAAPLWWHSICGKQILTKRGSMDTDQVSLALHSRGGC